MLIFNSLLHLFRWIISWHLYYYYFLMIIFLTGGCGELDIAEAIPVRSDQELITQMYHFDVSKSKGTSGIFTRPTTVNATFITIFDGQGKIIVI